MKQCNLCQKAIADKTGSHIIPNFMLTPMIGKRNYEKSILVSRLDIAPDIYYGRSNLDNNNEEQKEHHFTEDYILCSMCEKYLSEKLENPFSNFYKTLSSLDDKNKFLLKINEIGLKYVECKKIDYKIFVRLIYSIFWRMSISEKTSINKIQLQEEIQENLRKNILEEVFIEYPLIVITCEKQFSTEELGKTSFAMSLLQQGYHFIIIDNFFIVLYEKLDYLEKEYLDIVNFNISNPKMQLYTEQEWLKFVKQTTEFIAKTMLYQTL
jgi:hypothetical protein